MEGDEKGNGLGSGGGDGGVERWGLLLGNNTRRKIFGCGLIMLRPHNVFETASPRAPSCHLTSLSASIASPPRLFLSQTSNFQTNNSRRATNRQPCPLQPTWWSLNARVLITIACATGSAKRLPDLDVMAATKEPAALRPMHALLYLQNMLPAG